MKERYYMTRENNLFFAKRNLVDSIYSSSRLEGIAITFPETQEIYDGRNVAHLTVEEVVKVNNLKHAWQFVLDTVDYPLDLRYVRQLNQEIGSQLIPNAGELRTGTVSIGGTSWKPEIPDYENTREQIRQIMSMEGTTDKAITLMLYLMRAQLFLDGNKRVAQLAANQVMIQGGAGIIRIPVEQQEEFFQLLVGYYENGDMTEIKNFVYETSVEGYQPEPERCREEEPLNRQDFFRKNPKPEEEPEEDLEL